MVNLRSTMDRPCPFEGLELFHTTLCLCHASFYARILLNMILFLLAFEVCYVSTTVIIQSTTDSNELRWTS